MFQIAICSQVLPRRRRECCIDPMLVWRTHQTPYSDFSAAPSPSLAVGPSRLRFQQMPGKHLVDPTKCTNDHARPSFRTPQICPRRSSIRCSCCLDENTGGRPLETFTRLFGNRLLFVYHCFDGVVINGYGPCKSSSCFIKIGPIETERLPTPSV